jgi:3-phosphoglycerate kinase
VGGGETVEIVRAERAVSQLSLVSTGGGAMLEFLSKKALPGIRALEVFSPRKSSKK